MKTAVVCKSCQGLVTTPFCPTCGEPALTSPAAELVGFLTTMLRAAEKRLAALGPVDDEAPPDPTDAAAWRDSWRQSQHERAKKEVELRRQRVTCALLLLELEDPKAAKPARRGKR